METDTNKAKWEEFDEGFARSQRVLAESGAPAVDEWIKAFVEENFIAKDELRAKLDGLQEIYDMKDCDCGDCRSRKDVFDSILKLL